ncbi:hypothetical protein HMPREF3179_03660 [Oligella sp. HMSC09E12]|nr:hypothetical protein HMPREF3179_03660 [Oligella sp. HMSC09E12]
MIFKLKLEWLVVLLGILGLGLMLVMLMITYLETPIVQISYATKECVKVLPEGDCSELPRKFLIEWVK